MLISRLFCLLLGQVLFWGVREMKRYQFLPVDKPRIDIECAGHILSSSVVQNMHRNPNFTVPVKYFDVVRPPFNLRTVTCVILQVLLLGLLIMFPCIILWLTL